MAKEQEVKNQLMLTREDIEKAIHESQYVKKRYKAFWKFYEMLLEMNQELSTLQEAMEAQDGKRKNHKKK